MSHQTACASHAVPSGVGRCQKAHLVHFESAAARCSVRRTRWRRTHLQSEQPHRSTHTVQPSPLLHLSQCSMASWHASHTWLLMKNLSSQRVHPSCVRTTQCVSVSFNWHDRLSVLSLNESQTEHPVLVHVVQCWVHATHSVPTR